MKPVFNPGVNIELHLDHWAAITHALFKADPELGQYIADELATPEKTTNENTFIIYGLTNQELTTICSSLRAILAK